MPGSRLMVAIVVPDAPARGIRPIRGLSRAGAWLACCLSRGERAPLGRKDVEDLAADMNEQRFAGGTYIFHTGDPASRIHVVRSGSVELSKVVNGRRVILQLVRTGDVFGDVPALLGRPEPFDARAVDDSSILSIEGERLMDLLQTRPRVAQRWFVSLAERMAGLQGRLVDLLAGRLESQLASILLREADDDGDVRLSQSRLGEMLGVPQSSVQRVLKSMESVGVVSIHYRRIELVDEVTLASLVEEEGS